jgi:hypothetical protein
LAGIRARDWKKEIRNYRFEKHETPITDLKVGHYKGDPKRDPSLRSG